MKTSTILAGLFLAAGLAALPTPARAEMACCKAGGEAKSCCTGGASCEAGNAGFFNATRCGMCAAHKSVKKAAPAHPGHGGNAKMSCCIPVPCHEVGNQGFFTATKKIGCCSAMSKCDGGDCCATHGDHKGHAHH